MGIFEHFNMTGVPITVPTELGGVKTMDAGPGLLVYYNNPQKEKINKVEYVKHNNFLYLYPDNVRANLKLFENAYNVMSVLHHENKHFMDAAVDPLRFRFMTDYEKESSAIYYQMFHENWFKTTQAYRNSVQRYLYNQLRSAAKNEFDL